MADFLSFLSVFLLSVWQKVAMAVGGGGAHIPMIAKKHGLLYYT
jgi:hypothetical protein